jgi:predicted RNA-binding protein with PIN domain
MALHILIDGYNLIRQSPALSAMEYISTEEGRDALLKLLVQYKKIKSHKITVVFDAAYGNSLAENKMRQRGITIIFSRKGELADDVIKRMVAKERERAIVVTSDQEIVDFALRHGAATIDSREFEAKLTMASYAAVKGTEVAEEESGWSKTTKKKGPARRLPKQRRKSRQKIRKL